MTTHYLRCLALKYAWKFVGVNYLWGGETPMGGFDCSGFAQEVLRSVGRDPKADQTAKMLYQEFREKKVDVPNKGCLVFFGRSLDRISHVGIVLDRTLMLEAGGGTSGTVSRLVAIKKKAFVRMRPLSARRDLLVIVDPFR